LAFSKQPRFLALFCGYVGRRQRKTDHETCKRDEHPIKTACFPTSFAPFCFVSFAYFVVVPHFVYSEQELAMPVPAKQPPALKRQQGSPGTPTPLAFSCSADGGQFCDEAWKGIADKLELSQRQLDVCRGVVLGEQDKCIARTLGVSPRTIETHMGRVYEKLKIQNRAQLATRVVVAYHAWRMESNHPSVCPYKYGLESL